VKYVAALDDGFQFLVGSRRDARRHQSLRYAVQWSYDLLDEAEKDVLNRCSVFAGGFELNNVCAVAGFDNEYRMLDVLDRMGGWGLLAHVSVGCRRESGPGR
jgi:predicted ATPase